MKIIHLYPSFGNVGGAQSMIVTLYLGMKIRSKQVKIASFTPYDKIHIRYKSKIKEKDYIKLEKFKFVQFLKNNILISHHRKLSTLLLIYSKLTFTNFNLIHVAHNEFTNLKYLNLYPNTIISVSERVKKNLMSYFNISSKNIKVIYNGIEDVKTVIKYDRNLISPIKILYPARVNSVKKQLDLVKYIKKENIKGIQISFCGDGKQLKELRQLVNKDNRFIVKGFVENMEEEYQNTHFTMLFTEKEGLPVSLIESCKFGIPIICNDVGGNIEIVENEYNGYIINNYSDFNELIIMLKKLAIKDYQRLCKNSKNIFEKKFRIDSMIDSYLHYIDQIYE